jgi:hypothetical protein
MKTHYHRKPSALIDVRVPEFVVQIPIEQACITAIVPITTDEETNKTAKARFQPICKSVIFLYWGESPTPP